MDAPHPYDAFADLYDLWIEAAGDGAPSLAFYRELALSTPGPVVELGVGTGRIAIPTVLAGARLTGVDVSAGMLARCRARAEAAGVTDRLTLVHGDARDVEFGFNPTLVTLPYHSIGHFTDPADLAALLANVHRQLAPGGRFVFDHYLLDPWEERSAANPDLLGESVDPVTGEALLLWSVMRHEVGGNGIRIVLYTDRLDDDGVLVERRYRRLSFGWVGPDVLGRALRNAGFYEIELWGGFDRRPFGRDADHQLFSARRR